METTVKLYNYGYSQVKTYFTAALFIIGNIALPQAFHLIPQGGITWLPIYFFTLIAAYKYGFTAGLLTAILSPIVNSMLFGMPMEAALPAILVKSILLAVSAAYIANKYKKVSILLLSVVVLFYQIVGILFEWSIVANFSTAIQDFRIGIPGILLQILGGYIFIKYILSKF